MATNNFTAMGNIMSGSLVPLVEWFSNGLRNAVVWIAGFIKFLTGFDMIARGIEATNKKISQLGKTSKKSGQDMQKGLINGLDEINNISQNTSSSGGDSGGEDLTKQLGALKTLKEMMSEMNALDFSWATPLKIVFEFIRDYWEVIVAGIAGILVALKAYEVITALSALATNVFNISLGAMLTYIGALALAVAGVVAVILGIVELFKEGGNQTKAWTLILGGLLAIVLAVGLAFGAIPMAIAALVSAVVAGVLYVIKNWDSVKIAIQNGCNAIKTFFTNLWTNIKNIFGTIGSWFVQRGTDIVNAFKSLPTKIKTFFTNALTNIKNVFNSIGSWFSQRVTDIVNAFKSLPTKVMKYINNLWTKIKDVFLNVGSTMGNAIAKAIRKAINSVLTTAVNTINGFLKAINGAIGLINKIPGVNISKVKMLELPSFDVGTNYVPQDMIAQIHKGERIVPAKYNNDDWVSDGTDMTETNNLLEELIKVVASKNFTIGKDAIGRASLDYIKSESRRRGELVL